MSGAHGPVRLDGTTGRSMATCAQSGVGHCHRGGGGGPLVKARKGPAVVVVVGDCLTPVVSLREKRGRGGPRRRRRSYS